jgi:hypothetical protein
MTKGKRDFREFYDLNKVQVTLEFNPQSRMVRGQSIFKFSLKPEEEVT